MNNETLSNKVFEIDDLKRYIFSFLRKKARRSCTICNNVCVWETKLIKSYLTTRDSIICMECLKQNNYFQLKNNKKINQ
jgi:hypothetical protein